MSQQSQNQHGITLTIRQAGDIIEHLVKTGCKRPVMLVGAPAVGKTASIEGIVARNNWGMETLHPVLSDETDFNGSIKNYDDHAEFIPFAQAARLEKATKTTIFLLDDFGQARQNIQACVMRVPTNNELGGRKLSDKVFTVVCTNDRTHGAGVSGLLEPIKSRFIIIHVKPNLNEWIEDFAIPSGVEQSIISYLRLRPENFYRWEPTANIQNSPTARGWGMVNDCEKSGMPDKLQLAAYAGAVGEGAAIEYVGHKRIYQEIPTVDSVALDPHGTPIPTSPAAMFALAGAIGASLTRKNFGRIMEYVHRMPMEYGVLCIRDAVKHTPTLVTTAEWTKFRMSDLGKLCIGEDW